MSRLLTLCPARAFNIRMNAAMGKGGGPITPLRILGPLELGAGPPTLPRQAQVLLGVLLLRSNEVVSTQRIADEIWGERPPESWPNAIQVYVSRTRKALGETEVGAVRRQPPGYVAEVAVDSLDVLVFEQLCRSAAVAASTDPARAVIQLQEALALWRGPVLDGLTFESLAGSEIERLGEMRLEAIERRIELDLTLGRSGGVVSELELLVDEHPFRESLRSKLVLALYRAGRQADALAECRRARRFLVEELGIEPGDDLRQLERSVLRQDPAIAQPALSATASGPPASRGRRSVTAMCATLETSGLEDLDPELVESILAQWAASTRETIERSGGTIAVAGEGEILACFGLPSTREDDPFRACRAAVAVRDAHAQLPSERFSETAVGIGVEIGELIVGGDGSHLRGPLVSTARRLSAGAARGEIMLGRRVLEVVAGGVEIRDEREDGQATLVSVDRFAEAIPRDLTRPLVGRNAELQTLRRAFERCVAGGKATLVVVSGPAGIGKSRIVAELGSLAGQRATVLHGRCLPDEEGVAFAPLSAIVLQLLERLGRHGLTRLVAAEDDPDDIVARFLAIAGEERVESSSDETGRAVRKVLGSLASARPLVLAVDDLHWAEPAFLDLLEDIASMQAPIAVVSTTRSALLPERPAWAAERLDWSSIAVGSLPDDACAELLAAIPRAEQLTSTARQRIVAASGGNPLFVEQLAAMDTDWEDETVAPPVPASLRALLGARLDGLLKSERDVLEIASILDDTFTADQIVELLPVEERSPAESILGTLVEREFLRQAGTGRSSTRFSFVHPLIRTTCYDTIAKQRRGELHESYAGLVDQREQGISADEVIAHHLERAFRCRAEISLHDADLSGLARRARERLALAGSRRFAQGDLTTAVTLFGRASTSVVAPEEPEAGLLFDLGNAYREAGRLDDAERVLGRSIEAARIAGDEPMEWRVRASLVRVLLQVHGHHVHDVRALADETLVRLTTLEDADGLAMAWWVQGWLKWLSCQAAETERALGQAIEWARRAGNERLEAHSVNLYLGAGLFGPLPVVEAVRRCTLMRRRHHDRRRLVASCARALAVLRAMQGRLDEARGLVALDRVILEELGQRYLAASATEAYGLVELLGGDPEAAEQTLRHGYAELTRMGDVSALPTVAALLAETLVAAERYDDALHVSDDARHHTDAVDLAAQVQWRVPHAKALAWRGRDKKALRVAQDAVRLAGQTDFLNLHADALSALAEVHRMQGNRDEAAGALSQALLRYEKKGNVVAAARANVALRALRRTPAGRASAAAEVG